MKTTLLCFLVLIAYSCEKENNTSSPTSSANDLVGVWEEFEIYFRSESDPQNIDEYVAPVSSGFTITINDDLSYSGNRCSGSSISVNSNGLMNIDCGSSASSPAVTYLNVAQSPFTTVNTPVSTHNGDVIYVNYNNTGSAFKTNQYRYRKL